MSQRIENLRDAIALRYNCRAEHVSSTLVVERLPNGETWNGSVEVFELVGHPETKRCYAWTPGAGLPGEPVTVLEISPVRSAQTAVRAAMTRRQD